jgi:hypothetical protein
MVTGSPTLTNSSLSVMFASGGSADSAAGASSVVARAP